MPDDDRPGIDEDALNVARSIALDSFCNGYDAYELEVAGKIADAIRRARAPLLAALADARRERDALRRVVEDAIRELKFLGHPLQLNGPALWDVINRFEADALAASAPAGDGDGGGGAGHPRDGEGGR